MVGETIKAVGEGIEEEEAAGVGRGVEEEDGHREGGHRRKLDVSWFVPLDEMKQHYKEREQNGHRARARDSQCSTGYKSLLRYNPAIFESCTNSQQHPLPVSIPCSVEAIYLMFEEIVRD